MVHVRTLGRGVLLPELKLALDTSAPGYQSLVSHAHGDHIPWEARHAYASPETAELLLLRAPAIRVTPIPWREAVRVGTAKVTLLPAGHILGSALTLVESPDGETLLYTGDTKTRPSLTAATAEFPRADTLVVESTFGLPVFRFPESAALGDAMAAWARKILEEGATPVFLGYALGKSQEILAILGSRGIPTVAHGAVWNMARVYERYGVRFERARAYVAGGTEGAALVVPPDARQHPMVLKLDHHIAYCSGWARLAKSRTQLDADALFALSDHADHPGLLEIVERVGARRVHTNHGYADVFAHLLRKRGLDATPLTVGHAEEDAAPVAEGQTRLSGEA